MKLVSVFAALYSEYKPEYPDLVSAWMSAVVAQGMQCKPSMFMLNETLRKSIANCGGTTSCSKCFLSCNSSDAVEGK